MAKANKDRITVNEENLISSDDHDMEDEGGTNWIREIMGPGHGKQGVRLLIGPRIPKNSFIALCLVGTLFFAASYCLLARGSCAATLDQCQHHHLSVVTDPKILQMERAKRDLQRVKDVCKKYENSSYSDDANNLSYWHTNVDDAHKLLYFYIPKTGCTLWKAIFAIITGQRNETVDASKVDPGQLHHNTALQSLYHLPKEEQGEKLKSYFVFVVVRHPFERLVSGYVNKLDPGDEWFQKNVGSEIVKNYRKNATESDIAKGKPTFSEFVDYLIDPKTVSTYLMDSHWAQYYKIAHPCYVRYDYIARFETLKEDTQYLIESRNLSHLVNFTYNPPVTTNEKIKKFIRLLTLDQVAKLYDAYKFDFELFGYTFDIRNYF